MHAGNLKREKKELWVKLARNLGCQEAVTMSIFTFDNLNEKSALKSHAF